MSSKTWRFLHKWISIFVGAFLFIWTFSGIIMMIPARLYAPVDVQQPVQPEYSAAKISPSTALEVIGQSINKPVKAAALESINLQGRLIYGIWLNSGEHRLVDATNGEIVWIDEQVAEQIARQSASSQATLKSIEFIEKHDFLYPFGTLPVYRIVFDGGDSTIYYVSPLTGNLSRSTNLTRIVAAIASFHTFEPIKLFTESGAVRKGALAGAGLVALGTIFSGYYLAILPYLRKKSKSKSANSLP